jgi:hypothetical protein
MAVEVYKDRKAVVLQWNAGDYEGPVTIETSGGDDVSSTNLVSNAGYAAVTFPSEYSGTFSASVKDADGNVLDEGSDLEA